MNLKKYQPSQMAQAEQDTEKPQEKNPAEPTIKKFRGGMFEIIKPEKPYYEKATVNGVEIIVTWYDDSSKDYEIYFPQIKFGADPDVYDQVIRISRKPEVAKQVFDYATKLAETESDVYEIYKKVSKFARDLQYDIEE